MEKQSGAIRLTNPTARALRAAARRQRSMLHRAAVILTILLAALSVLWGLRRLIAVPLTLAAAFLLDALLIVLARQRYLTLTGQAICTEAAARAIHAQTSEQARRERARRDLASIKADLDSQAGDERPAPAIAQRESAAQPAAPRRRRQAQLKVIGGAKES